MPGQPFFVPHLRCCSHRLTVAPLGGSRHRAFSIPEMLAVVAIIAILISLLMAGMSLWRQSARSALCSANQHQIGVAIRSFYAAEHRMPNPNEALTLGDYMTGNVIEMYQCPENKFPSTLSYGVNPCIQKFQGEGSKIALLDARDAYVFYEGTNSTAWTDSVSPRHFQRAMNTLYHDGHVDSREPTEINPYTSAQILNDYWKPKVACDAAAAAGCGCRGVYTHWNPAIPTATRIDTSVHLPFGSYFWGNAMNIPLPGSLSSGWATGSFKRGVWTGKIMAPTSETYTFHVACDNEAYLFVNGQQILFRSAGGVEGVTTFQASTPISMVAGQWVPIEVRLLEYSNDGGSPSHVAVKWESLSTPLSAVPCAALRPN